MSDEKQDSHEGAKVRATEKYFNWPAHGITCFHCGEHFSTPKSARLHFGGSIDDQPGCIMKLNAKDNELLWLLRQKDEELWLYRQEDQPIMRELHALGGRHSRQLIEAEQKGYDRGLADGRVFLSRLPLPDALSDGIRRSLEGGMSQRETARVHGVSHSRVRTIVRKSRAVAGTRSAVAPKPVEGRENNGDAA
jgi:hypothetical protein